MEGGLRARTEYITEKFLHNVKCTAQSPKVK